MLTLCDVIKQADRIKPPCAHCGKPTPQQWGAINRALKLGAPIYCNRACAGIGRRLKNPPTKAERIEAKRLYDEKYRELNRAARKAQKAAYYAANHDREKEREIRAKRMPQHLEYCRRPEYKAWKAEYDKHHLARKQYGEFADAALLLRDIDAEIASRMTRQEVYQVNGRINKAQQRRRML